MEIQKSGLGSTAWRITEPDAPEQFALVYDARSTTIADDRETDVILVYIRCYAAYPLSYRHIEESMAVRGVSVNHSPINR